MTRRFPFLAKPAGSWLPYALYILGGLLLYSGTVALLALRYVPVDMDPRRWAVIAAVAAPVWAGASLAVALAVDAVSRFLFKRDAIGVGIGIVFIGTLFLNASGGHIGSLMGLAFGALFTIGLAACVVFLPLAFIKRRLEPRRKKSEHL